MSFSPKARYTLRVFSVFRIIFTTKVLDYKMMQKRENPHIVCNGPKLHYTTKLHYVLNL